MSEVSSGSGGYSSHHQRAYTRRLAIQAPEAWSSCSRFYPQLPLDALWRFLIMRKSYANVRNISDIRANETHPLMAGAVCWGRLCIFPQAADGERNRSIRSRLLSYPVLQNSLRPQDFHFWPRKAYPDRIAGPVAGIQHLGRQGWFFAATASLGTLPAGPCLVQTLNAGG
jgi:hypothetical protein